MTEEEFNYAAERLGTGELSNDLIFKTARIVLYLEKPESGYVKLSPDGRFETDVHRLSTSFGGILSASVDDVFKMSLETKVRDIAVVAEDDDFVMSVARKYFDTLVNEQVQCIQLAVKRTGTGSEARLQQTFESRYPWQAILSAMLKDFTGGPSPKKCANENCTEFFIPKKSHQIFCSRSGCRKAVSRQKNNELRATR